LPPDHINLLKLVWHPDDISGDNVKPTAFRRDDLSGGEGQHVSVDRQDTAARDAMQAVAEQQAAKANGKDIKREQARIGVMMCRTVRAITVEGVQALAVRPEPIEGNPAHCGIFNICGKNGRSAIDEMRAKLAEAASPPIEMDAAYPAA
jgi:hypothetical protein